MLNLNPQNLKKTQELYSNPDQSVGLYYPVTRFVFNMLGFAAAAALGYIASRYAVGAFPNWSVIIAALVYVYVAFVATMLGGEHRTRLLVAAGWGLTAALFMPWDNTLSLGLIALALVGSSLFAYGRLHHTKVGHATIRIFSLARSYTSVLVTGLALAVLALYAPQVVQGKELVSKDSIDPFSERITEFLPAILPDFLKGGGEEATISDLAADAAKRQFQDDPRFLLLTPQEQARAIKDAAGAAVGSIATQVGEAITPNVKLDELAHTATNSALNGLRNRYGWWFLGVWLLTVFFIVRSAGVLITLIAGALSWITITTALSLGFLKIRAVPSTREELSL